MPSLTNSQAFNRYSYVFNNPVNLLDPSGNLPVGADAGAASNFATSFFQRAKDVFHSAVNALKDIPGTLRSFDRTMTSFEKDPLGFIGSSFREGAKSAVKDVISGNGGKVAFDFLAGAVVSKGLGGLGNSTAAIIDDTVLSGHGVFHPKNGFIEVPKGSTVTTFTSHGNAISDKLGNYIETGKGITFSEFGNDIVGAQTYLSGSMIPNYTLYPPKGLNIMGTPITVKTSTNLQEMLRPNMGNVKWAACQNICN